MYIQLGAVLLSTIIATSTVERLRNRTSRRTQIDVRPRQPAANGIHFTAPKRVPTL